MVAMMLSGSTVVLLDLLAKRAVERRYTHRAMHLGPIADIRHVASRRRLYALAPFRLTLLIVWFAAFAAAIALAATGQIGSVTAQLAMGAALGGAAGNLYDILRSHSVRDYVDLGWWPVFNLADVAILGGLALAFIQL